MEKLTMEKLVNVCKQQGFIFQGSEIYGGLANTWDYGPLGVEFKNNVKKAWWKKFVHENKNSFGVDAAILMHPRVWEASGHVGSFSDPLIDCKDCKSRHRADHIISEHSKDVNPDLMTEEEMINYIRENELKCPKCGASNFTDVRQFNLMFETSRGVVSGEKNTIYLRPETAQGEFVNYLNVLRTSRSKVPFGIGQIGKAFRNEITPGNFIFRTIEFEQMEHQFFCKPGTDEEYYEYYKKFAKDYLMSLGVKEENIKYHDHDKLAHYAKGACDIYYNFPMGWEELWGTHNRTDFDLSRHEEYSGKKLDYTDPETNEKYTPYVIESSVGCDRMALALLCEAYDEEELEDGTTREVMRLHPFLAPYKVAVLPLIKKYHEEKANEVYDLISKEFPCTYDETGKIGKRYRRQDAIGTPFCVTIDDNTSSEGIVTVRDRDTMKQENVKIEDLATYINERIKF